MTDKKENFVLKAEIKIFRKDTTNIGRLCKTNPFVSSRATLATSSLGRVTNA